MMLSVFIKELKYLTSPAKNSCHNETRILPVVRINALTRRRQQLVSVVGFEALTAADVNNTISCWNVARFWSCRNFGRYLPDYTTSHRGRQSFALFGFFFRNSNIFVRSSEPVREVNCCCGSCV